MAEYFAVAAIAVTAGIPGRRAVVGRRARVLVATRWIRAVAVLAGAHWEERKSLNQEKNVMATPQKINK